MDDRKLYILTGPIHSGKTTYLQQLCKTKKDVHGIISPLINGRRFFVDLSTTETFPMEANGDEDNLEVGKYHFSKSAFDKASLIVEKASGHKKGWLIIDEIGPLELRGEGLAQVFHKTLKKTSMNLLVVIRENILKEAIDYFHLRNWTVASLKDNPVL